MNKKKHNNISGEWGSLYTHTCKALFSSLVGPLHRLTFISWDVTLTPYHDIALILTQTNFLLSKLSGTFTFWHQSLLTNLILRLTFIAALLSCHLLVCIHVSFSPSTFLLMFCMTDFFVCPSFIIWALILSSLRSMLNIASASKFLSLCANPSPNLAPAYLSRLLHHCVTTHAHPSRLWTIDDNTWTCGKEVSGFCISDTCICTASSVLLQICFIVCLIQLFFHLCWILVGFFVFILHLSDTNLPDEVQ